MGAGVFVLGTVVYIVDFCAGALIGVLIFQNPDAVLHLSGAVESLSAGMLDGLLSISSIGLHLKRKKNMLRSRPGAFSFLDKAWWDDVLEVVISLDRIECARCGKL